MGLDVDLHELDASRLFEAVNRLGAPGGLRDGTLRATFDALGGSFDDLLSDHGGALAENDASRFESALVGLLGRRVWSFERGQRLFNAADAVANLRDDFEPVRRFSAAVGRGDDGFDVALPPSALGMAGGLAGIWTADALRACLVAVECLEEPEAIAEIAGADPEAARVLVGIETWNDWTTLSEAIAATVAEGNALAFVIS